MRPIRRLLIANRGEIAVRIAQAANDLGITPVAIYSSDDARSLHVKSCEESIALEGQGTKPYLDIEGIVEVAINADCDAIHPGYGFLSETPSFASAIDTAGKTFVGPTVDLLRLLGDKSQARQIAMNHDVPVVQGTNRATSVTEARTFFESLPEPRSMMIKAVYGGGGRGSRIVRNLEDLETLFERCQSEARNAFGQEDVYVEQLIEQARHIEVQVIGDGQGNVFHLGERECSVQRRHQKIIEVAPAINLDANTRTAIQDAAVDLAKAVDYRSLGTFEFLLDASGENGNFWFMEANARLQVEHTVTEQVTGVDLVQAQLRLAGGESLESIGINEDSHRHSLGHSIQARINMEKYTDKGDVLPTGGKLSTYEIPSGPGIRIDGYGYSGYKTSPSFDSLLCKLIVHSRSHEFEQARNMLRRALDQTKIEGVEVNLSFLQEVISRDEFFAGTMGTRWVDEHMKVLVDAANERLDEKPVSTADGFAGARVNTRDPLALFEHDRKTKENADIEEDDSEDDMPLGPDGSIGEPAPIQGTIVSVSVTEGQSVVADQELVVMEAMKMEHVISSSFSGIVRQVSVHEGDVIQEGFPLVFVEQAEVAETTITQTIEVDLDHIRDDLAETYERRKWIYDENRPKAMERRERTEQQTARKNINDLCDEGSFIEYGPLVLAAQRRRRTEDWLRENTPADGLICGVGTINADRFVDTDARCVAVAYDYTVFAGTQGHKNHYKQDRVYELANRFRLPVVLFSEGGGGRPGDTDGSGGVGMDTYTFTQWSKLSARVPLVGVNSGRCFAGNTALLGCCDVIIATRKSTIAMGGPAMIEGGGLGIFTPEEVGPMSFQVPNGVVDIIVDSEAELIATAKKYLSYFQGTLDEWVAPDQRKMRHIVPENRLRMYNVRDVIETLADRDSILEIRKDFGVGIVTCFLRIEGRPFGLIANNPHHIAGAIDSDGADKGARFLQLCDAFDIPIISVMDCPGIMVGPEVEKTALVRHSCRMFNTGANLTVPMFGVIIRKAYGLGVQTMCGGSSMVPFFCVAWPTAEFAGMNIEGSVKLGYRNELAALPTAEERIKRFDEMVASSYERAKAINSAPFFGVDDVIDPADTRKWIVRGMKSLPPPAPVVTKKRPYIDTW